MKKLEVEPKICVVLLRKSLAFYEQILFMQDPWVFQVISGDEWCAQD